MSSHRVRRPRPARRWRALLVLSLCVAALPARAEYRLAAGDTLELAVAGLPEWRQRAVIQIDGAISLPVVGTVRAAGSTASEVQAAIESILTSKVIRQRGPDGRERPLLIQPGDVAVSVADYRPIVIGGDVQTPGQYPFRPLMTVRHALAASGGVSLVRGRTETTGLDAVEFDRERKSILIDYAKETARLRRLNAEAQGAQEIKDRPVDGVPLPAAAFADFLRNEARAMQVGRAQLARERSFLTSAVQQADEQIATLTMQEQEEKRGVEADMEELERTTRLLGSGNIVSQRVTDARRSVLLSSTRRLQTSTRLAEVRQLREDYLWRRAKLDSQYELDLLRDTKDAQARIAELAARLEGIRQKLAMLSRGQAGVLPGMQSAAEIVIVRRSAAGWDRLPASEETDLQPGDAIEVQLKRNLDTLMAVR